MSNFDLKVKLCLLNRAVITWGGDPFAKSLEESVSGPSGMATSAGQGSDPTGSNPSITMKQSGTEGVTASNSGQDVF